MSTKVIYSPREEDGKQELQKQLGCMNGIFQLFDRRYLLGQRRRKNIIQGQSEDGNNKDFNNSSEKPKENPKSTNKMAKEKHRVSIESSRNSFSSSCSSLDCSKRVQTEQSSFCPSLVSEPSSPTSRKNPDFSGPDIRDVVKDSMTRKPRVVPVKTVAKPERKGPAMTHVDSPRPSQQQKTKPVTYERKDQNLSKLREISRGVKSVNEISRFSCDERESQYKLKPVKELLPRLSLDSKQNSIKNRVNESRRILISKETHGGGGQTVDQTHEPGSNKRPPSSVVARLMGLEIEPHFETETVSVSVSRSRTRIPLEQAPWKQPTKNTKPPERVDHGQTRNSVYGEIEKRLTEVEFNASGKDLRALKQILEAIQRTKMNLENKKKKKDQDFNDKTETTAIKPAMVKKVNRTGARNTTRIETKAIGRTRKSVSPSRTLENPVADKYWDSRSSRKVSLRLQGSKNGFRKQSVCGPLSNGRVDVSGLKTGNLKSGFVNRVGSGEELCGYRSEMRSLSQQGETGSFISESDTSVTSQNEMDVTSRDWMGEKNGVCQLREKRKNKFGERLIESKPMAELTMPTMEQPSPVSVLDAFYTEDAPSPIQKKSYAFKDDEDLHFNEPEWNQAETHNLVSITEQDQPSSKFNHQKIENIIHQIELLNSTTGQPTIDPPKFFPRDIIDNDQKYINEILSASGFLKNLESSTTIIHLHPTTNLINPDLFNVLEKTKEFTKITNESNEKIRRKMIFDTVNNILVQKLARSASSELWTTKRKAGIMNGEKLMKELCSEINNLETNTEGGLYDEIINIIYSDVNKRSENWDDDNFNEVPGLVLGIERLIFKDLISEIVNDEVTGMQDGPERHCRKLIRF